MPVTKTAKRALKGSGRKAEINKKIISGLEIAIRMAKKTKKDLDLRKAASLTDRAKKKNVIHRNKAARIKSMLARLITKKSEAKASVKSEKQAKPKAKTSKK